MIKLTKTPVVGNYDTFEQAKFDYSTESLIPVFELEVENVPNDEYIKTVIPWDEHHSGNNTKRIPIFELSNDISKELEPLLEQFSKKNMMNMLDELALLNPNMFNYWGYDKSEPSSLFFDKLLDVNISIVKDNTDNEFSPHFDSRNTFGTMIINLVDNQLSTQFFDYGGISEFYKNPTGKDWNTRFVNHLIYEAPKQKSRGMFFVNCETTFHGVGINANADRERYALFVMLNLKNQ